MCLHFEKELAFYRLDVSVMEKKHDLIRFSEGPLGPIQTLEPLYTSALEGGEDIIFAGDASGRISMFKWSAKPDDGIQDVHSFRCIDVVPDTIGGITELAVNPYVLALGTARGTVHILDVLTLRTLRELTCMQARSGDELTAIREIILERDLVFIVAGDRVVTWKAGPVLSRKQLTPSKKNASKVRNVKWHSEWLLK